MRASVRVRLVRPKTLFLTFCLRFVIEFFCVLRSRDGKYTGKIIFDGSSVYMRASVRKWLAGGKELRGSISAKEKNPCFIVYVGIALASYQ